MMYAEVLIPEENIGSIERGRQVRLVTWAYHDEMFHGEVVHRNGKPASHIRAASYGFTLGGAVGLAMLEMPEPIEAAGTIEMAEMTQAYLDDADWAVDIAGRLHPARASLRPLYDPDGERIRS